MSPGARSPTKHDEPAAIGFVEYMRAVPPPSGDYEWVYLWERPLRVMHWLAALCIVVLAATGLFIGRPYFVPSGDPQSAYLMGWIRFIHFLAAAVLVMTAIVRVYWLFMGNRFERLPALFPLRKRDLRNLVLVVKSYLMITPSAHLTTSGTTRSSRSPTPARTWWRRYRSSPGSRCTASRIPAGFSTSRSTG
jgi:cytochrome b561